MGYYKGENIVSDNRIGDKNSGVDASKNLLFTGSAKKWNFCGIPLERVGAYFCFLLRLPRFFLQFL